MSEPMSFENCLSVKEAAGQLGMSSQFLRAEIVRGNLRAHRFGRSLRILPRDWTAYLKKAPSVTQKGSAQ